MTSAPSGFAVLADLPLGSYTGHDAGGGSDMLPAPARLHAALLAAAAQGPRAVAEGDLLEPSPADRVALRWLEEHPPDGVLIPAHRRFDAGVTAYRQIGLLLKDTPRILGKDDHRSVAVAGTLAWTWDEQPPEDVVDSLEELVADVSHLGTSQTPARVWIGPAAPTHRRDPGAELFATDGVDLDVATRGRLEALETAHRALTRSSRVGDDAVRSSEDEVVPNAVRGARTAARYVELDAERVPDGPWDTALLCQLTGPVVPPENCVTWAVAMHRALVATIGTGAPGVLTGAYGEGVPRPANRVAIQLLCGAPAALIGLDPSRTSVIVALPHGADAVEAARVATAVSSIRTLTGRGSRRRVTFLGVRTGSRFWPAPARDAQRRWATFPVAIPDTRPLRRQPWSLADAAALSVALVFRDEWPAAHDRGDTRYRRFADGAFDRGVTVFAAQRVPDSRVGRWVHRGHEGVVVQPYRVELSLGTLAGAQALVAVGQSRHLGGGLLLPTDLTATGSSAAPAGTVHPVWDDAS